MAGVSSKTASTLENKFKYNKGSKLQHEEFSDGSRLDWYEFKYRMDDAQIGRFHSIDPLADKYVYNSPYAFGENKVINGVELEGREFEWFMAKIVEAVASLQKDVQDARSSTQRIVERQASANNERTTPGPIEPVRKMMDGADNANDLAKATKPYAQILDITAKAASIVPIGEAGVTAGTIYTVATSVAESSTESIVAGTSENATVTKALGARFITEVEAASHGKVVATGTVDLQPTLDRVAAGDVGSMYGRNDGIIFQNKEGLLPTGVNYNEYVIPTSAVKGAGPMRLVQGSDGTSWFTSDHYISFIQVR